MRPDFPFKVFPDRRENYVYLMMALAEDPIACPFI
jgi:hypothetical protein